MNRMRKTIIGLLVLTLFLSLRNPIFATDGYQNFRQKNSYSGFDDAPDNAWYTSYLRIAYEYDLMNGTSIRTFHPQGNLTVAEAVTLAVRLYETYYNLPRTTSGKNGNWYDRFIKKAIELNLIYSNSFSDYNAPIKRGEFANLFSYIFPFRDDEFINRLTLTHLPDVDNGTVSTDRILMMYNLGIITGDQNFRFFPKATITRAEVAAILSRIVFPNNRKTINPVLNLISEKHLNRDYDWFYNQNESGSHSADNCGPCVTAMTLKWINPSLDVTPEKLRTWINPQGGWWYTNDIESVFINYGIPYKQLNLRNVQQLVDELENNKLILLCLDGYYMSDFYSEEGSGHFILVKGYTNHNGIIRFETYNPDNGKDAYYFANNILLSAKKWWPYYFSIGK